MMAGYDLQAFLNHFSLALHEEMKPHNVHIQSLVPYYINTRMVAFSSLLRSSKIFVPTPETYVKHAMWTLGYYSVNTGYFPHTLQVSSEMFSIFTSVLGLRSWK